MTNAEREQAKQELKRVRFGRDRVGITHRFQIGNLKGYMTVNELVRDGKPVPGELFLWIAKDGSTLSGFANAVALLVSLCLQYGVPLEVLCAKFVGWRFDPSGHVPEGKDIKYAESVLDYIFQWLANRYLGPDWIRQNDELASMARRKVFGALHED